MKTVIALPVFSFLCLFTMLPAFGQEITIANIQTSPLQVHVGDSFRINATIVNNSPDAINFNGGCQSPLSATFDKNVVVGQAMGCFAIYNVILNPGQNVTVLGPSSATSYAATSPGTTSANVAFAYHVGNKTENAAKIFTFDISEGTAIPEFSSLAGTVFAASVMFAVVLVSKARASGKIF